MVDVPSDKTLDKTLDEKIKPNISISKVEAKDVSKPLKKPVEHAIKAGGIGLSGKTVKLRIHSTELEKGPVDVTVGNANGMTRVSIPRDKLVEVPIEVAEVLKNTRVETEVPDGDEDHPHPMGDPMITRKEKFNRFQFDIKGEDE